MKNELWTTHPLTRTTARTTVLGLLLLLGACAGTSEYTRNVAPENATYAPKPDQALIVFMRPSGMGFAVQSSVFDVTNGNPEFIGIVSAKTKVAHYAQPGKRRYMVISEAADFMDANLVAGKVYYTLVTVRMGLWKARFSLQPVRGGDVATSEFGNWYGGTRWVENEDSAQGWADSNMQSIRGKMEDYLPKWETKPDKPVLDAGDGQASLYTAAQ